MIQNKTKQKKESKQAKKKFAQQLPVYEYIGNRANFFAEAIQLYKIE